MDVRTYIDSEPLSVLYPHQCSPQFELKAQGVMYFVVNVYFLDRGPHRPAVNYWCILISCVTDLKGQSDVLHSALTLCIVSVLRIVITRHL